MLLDIWTRQEARMDESYTEWYARSKGIKFKGVKFNPDQTVLPTEQPVGSPETLRISLDKMLGNVLLGRAGLGCITGCIKFIHVEQRIKKSLLQILELMQHGGGKGFVMLSFPLP